MSKAFSNPLAFNGSYKQ